MGDFKHVGEFWDRVGILRDYDYFDDVDIEACDLVGIFSKRREQELIEFCHKNPEYHIVSMPSPGFYVNGYTSKGRIYFLADGDRNPDLSYRIRTEEYSFIDR